MHLLVLSAFRPKEADTLASTMTCLNAPFGAQCFPTTSYSPSGFCSIVSMHLLVLSAFRLGKAVGKKEREAVSMHLLVLSAFRQNQESSWLAFHSVSMHLLVLSAFRPSLKRVDACGTKRLNAPFGAQCFPTILTTPLHAGAVRRLNAPFGAQCFPTRSIRFNVFEPTGLNAPFGAQCFPTTRKLFGK